MALREFTDRNGVQWRVWDVRKEALHPVTRSEEYLREYADGWLCFESSIEKRRLLVVPKNWHELPDDRLELMCRAASSSLTRHEGETSGEFRKLQDTVLEVEQRERRSGEPGPPGHPLRREEDRPMQG